MSEPVTLFLSLSGRAWAWPLTRRFLEEQTFPHAQIHLVMLDTSQSDAFGHDVRSWLAASDYGSHTYLQEAVGEPGIADRPRAEAAPLVRAACARIYNRFARLCHTPLVLFLEDDVIPPDDAYVRLTRAFEEDVISVSGAMWHRTRTAPIVWDWNEQGLPTDIDPRTGVTPVGGNGFGCLALRGEYLRQHVFQSEGQIPNFDQAFYASMCRDRGMKALVDWECRCRHHHTSDSWA